MPPAPPPPPPPPPPVAPVQVGTIPNQAISTGQSATLEVSTYFRDPDGGALTYTVESSAAGIVSVSLSGSTLTMVGVADGTATVTVTARDPDGLTAAQGFQVTVETPNRAPEAVGTIPSHAVATGSTEALNVSSYFRDPDGDALTYTAASSSAAVVSISLSGSTLTMVGVADGTATVTVTARDPDGLAAAQAFQVTVETPNRAPEAVGTIPSQTIDTGSSSSPVNVSAYFRDPDGDALTYTAASSAPAVVSVSVSGSALTVSGVAAGTATVTVTARDPDGLTVAQGFQVTVETPNRAPEAVGTIPNQTVNAGSSRSVDVSSNFRDPDGDALTYTAASSNAAVAAVAVSGARVTVSAVAAGTATVTVTARDPDGLTAAQGFRVTVETPNRAPEAVSTIPSQSVATGQAAPVDVSSYFRDPDGDALTYAATSSAPAVVSVSVSGSAVTVSGVAAGTATVTVTARDPDGLAAAQAFQVTVETPNRAPEAVGTIPSQSVVTGQAAPVDVSSYFRDPDGDALTYAATSSAPAVVSVSVSGSAVTVSGVAAGTATVTVTARDPDGLTAAQRFQVTVEMPNRAPEAVGTIPSQSVVTGQAAPVDVSPYFRDPDGDALIYAATSSAPAVVSVSVSGSSVRITGVAAGSATVTVTARDPGGLTGTQRFGVTVRDGGGGDGVRDDFDSSASLGDWEVRNANASVADGTLRLMRTTSTLVGIAERQLESPLTDWTIRARVGSEAAGQLVGVWWLTGNADYPVLAMTLGTIQSYNYTMWFFDAGSNDWRVFGDLIGHSSAVRTGAGEFTNIAVGFEDRTLVVSAGDTQLINLTLPATNRFVPAFTSVESIWLVNEGASSSASLNGQAIGIAEEMGPLGAPANSPFDETVGAVDGIPLKNVGARNSTSLFDWVEVTGEASGGGGGNRAPRTVGTIPAMTVTAGSSENVNASSYFRDPDGDALTYTASSSRTSVATVRVSGRTVTVAGVAAGTAMISVTATDPGGLSAVQTFGVTVEAGGGGDRDALVALYNATDGPNWIFNSNWLTDAPLGDWYGVDTDASGRVVQLNLRFAQLTGAIPPELGRHLPE
ncbi:MAG: putative Ig domain-containing protein [Gammaproteobacteria bacterium]|nr:putative Ig domain-containing protein [Gammaproteobacteria bacterium]